jgi:cation transport ATPase
MKFLRKIFGFLKSLNGDHMEEKEVSRMEKRLQMLIALVFFTPTVLASLGADTFKQDTNIQVWCAIVSMYILIYIIIELCKGKINKLKGTILNYGIWVNLSAFVPYLLTVALYPNDAIISGLPLLAFFLALIIVFWSPVIVLLMLGLEFLFGETLGFKR